MYFTADKMKRFSLVYSKYAHGNKFTDPNFIQQRMRLYDNLIISCNIKIPNRTVTIRTCTHNIVKSYLSTVVIQDTNFSINIFSF